MLSIPQIAEFLKYRLLFSKATGKNHALSVEYHGFIYERAYWKTHWITHQLQALQAATIGKIDWHANC